MQDAGSGNCLRPIWSAGPRLSALGAEIETLRPKVQLESIVVDAEVCDRQHSSGVEDGAEAERVGIYSNIIAARNLQQVEAVADVQPQSRIVIQARLRIEGKGEFNQAIMIAARIDREAFCSRISEPKVKG